jgi:hypothetical protein
MNVVQNFFIKIALALQSKTCWTIATFLAVHIPQVQELIPVKYKPAVDVVLAILAMYFRLNPNPDLNRTIAGLSK